MRRSVKEERGWTLEVEFYFAGYCMKWGKLLNAQDPQTTYIGISKALLAFFFFSTIQAGNAQSGIHRYQFTLL